MASRVKEATEATEEITVETTEETKPEITVQEYMNERVPFTGFFDAEKYKDDITVTVNGTTWQIQRGVEVMIPRYVKKAIDDAEAQKRIATVTSLGYEKKFSDLANKGIL